MTLSLSKKKEGGMDLILKQAFLDSVTTIFVNKITFETWLTW